MRVMECESADTELSLSPQAGSMVIESGWSTSWGKMFKEILLVILQRFLVGEEETKPLPPEPEETWIVLGIQFE